MYIAYEVILQIGISIFKKLSKWFQLQPWIIALVIMNACGSPEEPVSSKHTEMQGPLRKLHHRSVSIVLCAFTFHWDFFYSQDKQEDPCAILFFYSTDIAPDIAFYT